MAERDSERRTSRPALLVGAGRRAREVGAVLAALSALDGEGERRLEPCAESSISDLEELLAPRPQEGLLILESARVPSEDIGFVRRFLERHPLWRLLVLGEEQQEARARALLALARAQWLPWPPDLDQLRALLGAKTPAVPAAAAEPAREERGGARKPARRAATVNGGVNVGDLVEELLAAAALHGDGAPRYQFRSGGSPLVQRERASLQDGLGPLVELARHCAGADGLVRAAIDPNGEAVLIGLEFPRGALVEKDLPGLLERAAPAGSAPELAAALGAARHGATLLRELGGRVELAPGEAGRVRCEVRLSIQPAAATRARAVKPEDPFA